MASQGKEKVNFSVKDLRLLLEKCEKNARNNKKDDLSKTISSLQDSFKKVPDNELMEKGKSVVQELRKRGDYDKLPQELKQNLSAFDFKEQPPVDQKRGDGKGEGKRTGSSPKPSDNETGVDVGHAQGFPTPSSHSPTPLKSEQKDGKKGESANHQEIIKVLESDIENARSELKKVTHLSDDRLKQIRDLEKNVQEKEKKLNLLEVENEHLSKSLQDVKMQRNVAEKEAKETGVRLEKHLNEKLVECQDYERRIQDLETRNQNLEKQKLQCDNMIKQLQGECAKLDKQKFYIEQQANKTIDHLQDIMKEEKRKSDEQYKKLLAERDDLRDRFSKLAGKKLQEQNADIADLSDPNRAMKLSEKFGQLYDDEWTNAFENLTDKKLGLQTKDAIHVLLRVLQECWTFCNNLVGSQMESLQSVFLHPAQNLANYDQRKIVGGLADRPRITSKDSQSLRDLRRRVGVYPSVIDEVKQALLADSKSWDKKEKSGFERKHMEACTPYLQKCAEICWLMALHDPPLFMKMEIKQGEALDTNVYTVYSATGKTVDFLVWPPLFNGSDGGLLSKGVAEPLKVVGKKK